MTSSVGFMDKVDQIDTIQTVINNTCRGIRFAQTLERKTPNRHLFTTDVEYFPMSEEPWCLATCCLEPFEMCRPDRPRP